MGFKKVRGLKKSYSSKFIGSHKKRISKVTGVVIESKTGSDHGRRQSGRTKKKG